MTTLREAVANLIKVKGRHNTEIAYQRLIEAYDAALAAKEPEPVAWMHIQGDHQDPCFRELTEDEISRGWTQKPLYYTAPPQREWQGLTDEDYEAMAEKYVTNCYFDTLKYARAIEARLKEQRLKSWCCGVRCHTLKLCIEQRISYWNHGVRGLS